jgi:hypothetical protein
MNFLNPKFANLKEVAARYKDIYQGNDPFPNISFEKFFDEDMLDGVINEFEDLDKGATLKYDTPNEVKLASKGETRFGDKTKAFVHYLNSEPFLEFLQELTGIDETLMPDPYLEGAGYHQTKAGGFLKIHADFNKHKLTKLDRRLNVLVYLNKDWKDEYGGHFEMWDTEMTHCVKKVRPDFGTMALFSTTDFSYHGLPNPLTCPPDRSRKSIALYYFSNGRPASEVHAGLEDHTTLFKVRKGDTVDAEMLKFNKKQGAKEFLKDLTPPILFRAAKSVMGKE